MDPATLPVILTYHSISEGPSPTQISAELFAEQMQWLHDNTRVAPLSEVVAALLSHTRLPERTVALTFDDGYRDFYFSAAPLLRRLKMPATIFLPTGLCSATQSRPANGSWHPEHPLLDWPQVAELAREGFAFGAHSVTHPVLPELQHEQAHHEIAAGKIELEKHTGQKAEFFAYPYGRWNDSVRTLVRQHYRAACSTGAGVVLPESDPFALPRVDAHYLRRPAALRMIFTAPFLAYVATRRLIRRLRRQPEGIYATV
ncbi:MAG: polysaccharide deacetylase family protein [Candidatus Korobacteraceae bacterium]